MRNLAHVTVYATAPLSSWEGSGVGLKRSEDICTSPAL